MSTWLLERHAHNLILVNTMLIIATRHHEIRLALHKCSTFPTYNPECFKLPEPSNQLTNPSVERPTTAHKDEQHNLTTWYNMFSVFLTPQTFPAGSMHSSTKRVKHQTLHPGQETWNVKSKGYIFFSNRYLGLWYSNMKTWRCQEWWKLIL